MTFYIFHRHRVCLVDCVDLICSFVQLVQRFWVFFLSHTAPGFQLWFYFHRCRWVVHWGLLLRLPWRTQVCPCEGQVWRWCSCLGRRGSGSNPPSLTEKPGRPQSAGSQRAGHCQSDPVCTGWRLFACGSSAPVRVEHEGGAAAWLAGTLAAPSVQGHGLPPPQESRPCESLSSSLL